MKNEGAVGLVSFALFVAIVAGIAFFLPPVPTRPLYAGAGATEPQRGGTFVFFHESDLRSLDPHLAYDELSNMAIKLLFEGLIEHGPDIELVPRIARALPDVSEDG